MVGRERLKSDCPGYRTICLLVVCHLLGVHGLLSGSPLCGLRGCRRECGSSPGLPVSSHTHACAHAHTRTTPYHPLPKRLYRLGAVPTRARRHILGRSASFAPYPTPSRLSCRVWFSCLPRSRVSGPYKSFDVYQTTPCSHTSHRSSVVLPPSPERSTYSPNPD